MSESSSHCLRLFPYRSFSLRRWVWPLLSTASIGTAADCTLANIERKELILLIVSSAHCTDQNQSRELLVTTGHLHNEYKAARLEKHFQESYVEAIVEHRRKFSEISIAVYGQL